MNLCCSRGARSYCVCRKTSEACTKCKQLLSYARTAEFRHFFVLYIITFLVVLPLCCHNVKHTLYSRHTTGNATRAMQDAMRRENDARLSKARDYFHQLNYTKALNLLKSFTGGEERAHVHVSISIITTSRNRHKVDKYEPHYLTQVVWNFFVLLQQAMEQSFPYHVQLSVCNVDSEPDSYKEAKYVSSFLPVHTKDANHKASLHPLEKEKQDYVYCLNTSLHDKPTPDFVFLVEDDALPHKHLFSVLHHVIDRHLLSTYHAGHHHKRTDKVAYVKFYHPERVVEFIALERERLPEMFGCGILLATILTPLYFKIFHTNAKTLKIWFSFFIYSLLLVLAIGRVNVMELRRFLAPHLYSFSRAPSCCTPAMLFPREEGISVVNFLNQTTCKKNYGKDSVLDDMLRTKPIKAYLVQPNLFTHIGLYSSLRPKILDPFMV